MNFCSVCYIVGLICCFFFVSSEDLIFNASTPTEKRLNQCTSTYTAFIYIWHHLLLTKHDSSSPVFIFHFICILYMYIVYLQCSITMTFLLTLNVFIFFPLCFSTKSLTDYIWKRNAHYIIKCVLIYVFLLFVLLLLYLLCLFCKFTYSTCTMC